MNHLIYYKETINIFYGPYNDISIIHYMIIHDININIHHTILWTIISIIQYISSYYNRPYFTICPYFMDHLINIHNII